MLRSIQRLYSDLKIVLNSLNVTSPNTEETITKKDALFEQTRISCNIKPSLRVKGLSILDWTWFVAIIYVEEQSEF